MLPGRAGPIDVLDASHLSEVWKLCTELVEEEDGSE
jgi:hypothetical protein